MRKAFKELNEKKYQKHLNLKYLEALTTPDNNIPQEIKYSQQLATGGMFLPRAFRLYPYSGTHNINTSYHS